MTGATSLLNVVVAAFARATPTVSAAALIAIAANAAPRFILNLCDTKLPLSFSDKLLAD
jgi:hypothetical protein